MSMEHSLQEKFKDLQGLTLVLGQRIEALLENDPGIMPPQKKSTETPR